MTPNSEPFDVQSKDGSTRVFCATCGHSEFVHTDDGSRRCLYVVCDCNRFVVGAGPDLSAQVLPP